MTDRGSFTVQSEKLRAAAQLWAGCAADAATVKSDLDGPRGQGYMFGVLAGSCGVTEHYNTWSQQMYTAVGTAEHNFTYLDAALNSCADNYDGVDATAGVSMQVLDGMIER